MVPPVHAAQPQYVILVTVFLITVFFQGGKGEDCIMAMTLYCMKKRGKPRKLT